MYTYIHIYIYMRDSDMEQYSREPIRAAHEFDGHI